MCDQILTPQIPQSVLELHKLNEQIMFRIKACRAHRTLEIEAQPLLDASHTASLGQIEEQNQIQNDRRGQNAVPAEEIDLDLHGIAQPAVDIDIVPTFLVVTTRRVVVNPDFMGEILIKLRVQLRLEDLIQNRELALFLCLEGLRIVQHL